jgi:beta-aspartyl-peptidase (threonine type)
MLTRRLLSLLLFALMAACHGATQDQAQPAPKKPPQMAEEKNAADTEIRNALASQVESWNRGNIEGFMRGYWRSPELTFFSGATITKGWEPMLQHYRQRYQGEGKQMGRLAFEDLHVDQLGKRGAVVTGTWQLTMSDGKQPHGLFTLVLKRMPDGWKIVHDHTSAAD